MSDRVGQQLGNYRLVRLLGQGGFAEVYLGEHVYLETQAAIKVLHTQLAREDIEQFRIEARTIARLEHPYIVRVLDFGVEGSTPFLVMSYAPNGTLRQRHPKGTRLPLTTVVSYVKQIAPALQYAHEQKLIHRDIKPENLLVGRANEILLSDFGIALVAQSSRYQSTRDMAGTIAYMAPEQIEAHPRPASDQYSFGIVVYEWLSGDRPFHGSFTEIAIKHSLVPPPSLKERVPTLSLAVEQVVMTALAKDPKQRFATVQAFANAFEQASQIPADENKSSSWSPQSTDAVNVLNQPQQPTKIATSLDQSSIEAELSAPPSQTPLPIELIPPRNQTIPPTEVVLPFNRSTVPPDATIPSSQSQRQSFVAESSEPAAAPPTTKADLTPLGLSAFACTTFVISASNAGLIPIASVGIITLALFYGGGGLVQFIAGIQAYRAGQSFGATAFCSYGAFWLSFAAILIPGTGILAAIIPALHQALGVYLLGWTIFTGLMFLGTLRSNIALMAVFGLLFLTFLFLTIGELGPSTGAHQIGGYLGIFTALITALMVWYTVTQRSKSAVVQATAKANPALLGLCAFALTTFVLSSIYAGWFPVAGINIVVGLALFYGGLAQLLAGMWEFRSGNTFGATAFCSYGAFWLSFAAILIPGTGILVAIEPVLHQALGIYLLGWTIFTGLIVLSTFRRKIALMAVFGLLFLTYLFLTIGELGPSISAHQIGGYLGVLTAIVAWYIALAFLLVEVRSSFLLPVGPRG